MSSRSRRRRANRSLPSMAHPGWQNGITTRCSATRHRCWKPISTMRSGFMTSSPRPSRKEYGLISPIRPWARPAWHPLAEMNPGLPSRLVRSAAGIDWELRRAPRPDPDLVRDSQLCSSQRLYQLNLVLDGRSREGASIWLRTRNGQLTSRLIRPWPGGELARHDGIARPGDFTEPWETYLEGVVQRRRAMGR
jgi:hypothetical protein